MINRELEHLSDPRVLAHIRSLLVEPKPILRNWDYGPPGQQYPCWAVLDDDPANSDTGIAYCEYGFGPDQPWGLVWLGGDHMSMGMDSGWYPTFLDAYFESFAPTVLPIWRVIKNDPQGNPIPLTGEGGWDERWKEVEELKKTDPNARLYVHHCIAYDSEIA